jgi:hypothetical protein
MAHDHLGFALPGVLVIMKAAADGPELTPPPFARGTWLMITWGPCCLVCS